MSSVAARLMGKLLSKRNKCAGSARSASTAGAVKSDGGIRDSGCGDSGASGVALQHGDAVVSVASLRPGLCLSGSKDQSIILYDYNKRRQEARWTGHLSAVTKVCYGSECQGVFSASRDTTVKMWRTGKSDSQQEYLGHSLVVTAVHISSDSMYLCSGSRDNAVKLWDVETATCIKTNTIPQNLVTDVKFVAGSNLIVQTGEDKEVKVFDHRSLQIVFSFPKKQYIQMCCDISTDGNYVISSSNGFSGNGCQSFLWDMRTRKQQQEYRGHTEAVEACLFLPGMGSNPQVVTSSRDCSVKVWNQQTGICECQYMFDGSGPLTSLAAYPDKTILVGTFNQGVQVLKLHERSLDKVMSF